MARDRIAAHAAAWTQAYAPAMHSLVAAERVTLDVKRKRIGMLHDLFSRVLFAVRRHARRSEQAGFSLELAGRRRYLLAPLVGDAILRAARAPLRSR